MPPVPAATSIAPSTIFHFAGPCVLSDDRHLASDFPSNRTMASDGGGADSKAPGFTTGGLGRSIECCGHCCDTCAPADVDAISNSATAARVMVLRLVAQRVDVCGDGFDLIVGERCLSAAFRAHRKGVRLVLDRVGGHPGHDDVHEILVAARALDVQE